MTVRVAVVGGTIEGVQAALDIANSGIEVTLIENSPALGSNVNGDAIFLRPKLLEAGSHPNIQILTGVDVTGVERGDTSFDIKLLQHPRYVNTEACTSCGRCEQACPVTISSRNGVDIHKAIHRPDSGVKSVPSTCLVDKRGVAPCTAACPAGINVQGYVALISKGKLREALDLIREAVPFPHILGRVCTHPCETVCTRGKVDQPIGIASLKRYLADMEPAQYSLIPSEDIPETSSGKVAIVGSGPAGLTCARDLLRLGRIPTVFEALPVAGGMIAVGMPRFRLPREVREAEISALFKLGIEIKTSTRIGTDITIDDLWKQGYEAIFVAIGCHRALYLGIPGEKLNGVTDGVTFLRALRIKEPIKMGNRVVVVGGGYTGIDVARAAIRLRSNRVHILERYTEQDVSATPAEILETREEGVDIQFLTSPVRIIGENGKVVGVECQRLMRGESDENGRPTVVPIEGSEFTMKADTVIIAIGQLPDTSFLEGLISTDRGTVTVDPLTLSTNVPGIFAGGDAVTGPRSMVEAVGAGRRAAVSIDRYLRGEDMRGGRTLEKPTAVEVDIDTVKIPIGKRRRIPVLPIKKRKKNFEEVERGYTTFMALREAKRCLNCAGCSECMECVRNCELEAVDHTMQRQEIGLEASVVVFAASPQEFIQTELLEKLPEQGIYVAGPGSEDGDITRRLTHASAIAGRVMADLARYRLGIDAEKPGIALTGDLQTVDVVDSPREPGIGVFVCRCGGNISDVIDTLKLVRYFYRRSGVSYSHEIDYACSDEGVLQIRDFAEQHNLTHVVLAACPCCSLDQICFSCSDRRIECKSKLLGHSQADGICYEFVNIREHCSWVHTKAPQKAMEKARTLIWAGIARARESRPQRSAMVEIKRSVMVIGAGLGGLQAAVDLGAQGFQTILISNDAFEKEEPSEVATRLKEEFKRRGGMILQGAQLQDVRGSVGEYKISLEHKSELLNFSIGAIVVDVDATGSTHLPTFLSKAIDVGCSELEQTVGRMPGVFLCGMGLAKTDIHTALIQGSAAASKASALLHKGGIQLAQTVAIVDPCICRGCGTCTTICQFGAVSLVQKSSRVLVSRIDEAICRGCGTCVAHCPSGAINQAGLSDHHISAALEAMLSPL